MILVTGAIGHVARAALPFFLAMVAAVLLIYLLPGLVTALPDRMLGTR